MTEKQCQHNTQMKRIYPSNIITNDFLKHNGLDIEIDILVIT